MKKILLITLLLIPVLGFSQTDKPIDGFSGIKFGSTKQAVIAAMKAKGATLVENDKDELVFKDVKLGKRDFDAALIDFVNNKVYQADFFVKPDVDGHTLEMYDDLVSAISGVYGTGNVTKDYTDPYKEGDGNTLLGMSAGKVDYHTSWNATNKNSVIVSIVSQDTELNISLTYIDQDLKILADKAEALQNKSDL